MPQLSAPHLNATIDQLLAMRERSLLARPVEDIAASIDTVVARFLTPTSSEYQEAVVGLPEETGLSPEMIRHTLPLIFAAYRRDNLLHLLQDELSSALALDEGVRLPGKWRKAYGPSLVIHVLAGNIPGAGLDGIIFALLMKSATLVKTASSASLLPTLFARCLNEVDPDLGACLAVVTWPGGHTALEEVAFSRAEVVVASGTEASLATMRMRVRGRFIGYGHKISFSVITKEALAANVEDLARRAAYDIALFDQQGCLSPQLVYVETGSATTPQAFAALLAHELHHWQQVLPRGRIAPEASLAIRRVRDDAEWQALAGKEVVLHTSPHGTEWTVIYEADPAFASSPLYRTVRVKPFHNVSQLTLLLHPWQPYLEAAGVAALPSQFGSLAVELGRVGVSRVCQIGSMQAPPLSWRHGGRPRLADMVRWVESEEEFFVGIGETGNQSNGV